jgi:SAM-dependent methyltransferase
MNRTITNAIRYVMDNWIPPVIRDSRWFMYPFFYIWYKGKNVKLYMDFKDIVFNMTDEEYYNVDRDQVSLARDRPTDMNMPSIKYLLTTFDKDAQTLLDVGCGRGFVLNYISDHTNLKTTGCDLHDKVDTLKNSAYEKGTIYKLPFPDNSFDIVFSSHTIEHLRNVPDAIKEMKRVARKQLIIVTPCQRYYFYTMDGHLNFYPTAAYLQHELKIEKNVCKNIQGDWVYVGYLNKKV